MKILNNVPNTSTPTYSWLTDRRYFFLIVVVVFVLLSVTTFTICYRHNTIITEQALKEDRSAANLLSLVMDEHLKKIVSVMESYCNRPLLLQAVKDKNVEKARGHLINLTKSNPDIDVLVIADRQGTLWASYPERPEVLGKNLAYRDWYKGVSKEWKYNISDVVLRIVGEKDLAVQISVPFFDETGEVIGILVNTQRTVKLNHPFKQVISDPSTSITITDQKGQIVYSSQHDFEKEILLFPFHPSIRKATVANKKTVTVDAPDLEGGAQYISFSPLLSVGWTVFVGRDKHSIILSESTYCIQMTAIALLLFLSSILSMVYLRKQMMAQQITKQLQTEKELRARDQRYKSYIDVTMQLGWTTDDKGEIVEDNPSWRKYTGRSYEEFKGFGWIEDIHPDDRDHTEKIWKKAVAEESFYETEYRIRRYDGVYRDYMARGTPLLDENGSIREWVGTCIDITDRKQADTALINSEKRYRNIFENATEGIFQSTTEGRYISVNPAFARIGGYDSPDEMIDTITDIQKEMYVHQDDRTRLLELLNKQDIITNFEAEIRRRDNAIIWISMNVKIIRDENGKTVLLEGTIVDITAHKHTEEALKISETRYRRLFESAQDGILILDADTEQVIDANPFMQDLLGYSCEEFVGKRLWDIGAFKDIDASRISFGELQSKGYVRYEDLPLETSDGRHINVEFVSNVYMVDSKRVIQCNIRNITARKHAEDALKQNQQQQLQIRDQFLSRMSHELRSPLTPVHQFVTILLDGLAGDLNAEQREYLLIILRNINSLRTMVSDLLSVTRAESGKLNIDLRCVYLTELIPKILKNFQIVNTKDLLLSFDVSGNLPPVLADMNRVQQILDNLLGNAVKSAPEKGGVSIRARVSPRSPGFVRMAVTDTGCGIAKSEQEKIFEYLYQVVDSTENNHKGLGIGLYICRELVSSHGGRIWVKSQPGQGSTFFFTLPVFSLERQLASITKVTNLITHSIALITVEVSHVEKDQFKGRPNQAALGDAWDVLQSCTLPNVIVLLPRVSHRVSKDFFFIVACVNQSSAEVLVEQLRDRLERCRSLRDSNLEPKISFILLDTRSKSKGNLSRQLANKKVVDHIGSLIKTTLHEEEVLYE